MSAKKNLEPTATAAAQTRVKWQKKIMSPIQHVETASVIVYDSDCRILLAKRRMSKSMDPGLWETIGGTVESEESSLEAIKREVSEEFLSPLYETDSGERHNVESGYF